MSYFINKISNAFKGLLIQNNNNFLEINESGRLNSALHNIENFSKNKIVNISTLNNELISQSGNIILQSEEGELTLKSGKGNSNLFNLLNPSYDENDDSFFSDSDSTKINNLFADNESVLDLKNNSLLIESLDTKSICLYSNNGINQISHGNMNFIGDNEILFQSSNKLNLTSLGYLTLNSERMISNIEEDLIMLSGSGEIKLGGNGITTTGIKINNNTNKNYLSIGNRDDNANRNLHIDINQGSFDNTKKNGIIIESKDINNSNTLPEIELNNYDKSVSVNQTKLQSINLGVGSDNNDKNNSIFVSKENTDGNTFIIPLNKTFKFNQNDINKIITYSDNTFDTIISVDITNNKAQASVNLTSSDIRVFNSTLKQGYINRDDYGYIKTKTDTDLILGSNNNNIININNSGNIGINNLEPLSTLEVNNNYGLDINIRTDNSNKYYNPKVIQFSNSNYLIVFVTESVSSTYNIEGFIYNTNNNLVSSFNILENTTLFPQFNLDNLHGTTDRFVIIYSYWNGSNVLTQSYVFTNSGLNTGLGYLKTHENLTSIFEPSVKSFQYNNSGILINGYVTGYIDQLTSGNRHMYFNLFLNTSSGIVSSIDFISLIDSFVLQDNLGEGESIKLREFNSFKFGSMKNINGRQRLPLAFNGKITLQKLNETDKIRNYILFNSIILTFNSTKNSLELLEKTSYETGEDILKLAVGINDDFTFNTKGFDVLTLDNETIVSYYLQKSNETTINSVYYEILNNSNYILGTPNKLDDSNIVITDDNHLNYQFPSITLYNTDSIINKYFISYYILEDSKKQIKYFNSSTNTKIKLNNSVGTQVFIKRLVNTDSSYLSTLLLYNYDSVSNIYNNDSIILNEIDTESSFINFKNLNNDIKIKNSGEVDLNKQKINNFVLSGFSSEPTSSIEGVEGEMNYFGSNLYIYLGGNWNKVTLTSI